MKKYFFLVLLLCSSFLFGQTETKRNNSDFMMAGTISVTIGGDFIVTGTYPALITERVDPFITRMYNEAQERILTQVPKEAEFLEKAKKDIESYSIRNVILKRSNGEELHLDLLKFRRTGDFSHNPYLRNDDVLIFPPTDLERNFFSVSGAVNKPGKYHFKDGDKLSDAIELAQGINKAYENVSSAEIYRLSYDGQKMETITVDVNSNTALQRGDRVVVAAAETQKKEFSITVLGEVKNPGEVFITRSTTTVEEAIQRAGGLTDYAALKRARLFTGNSFNLLVERLYGIDVKDEPLLLIEKMNTVSRLMVDVENAMMYRMSNVTLEDTGYFFLENELRVLMEGTSLEMADESGSNLQQIVKDGDILVIPKKKSTVYVFGQVAHTGHIPYAEGQDIEYYLQKAGGMGIYAQDKDEIMVIKSESRQWISPYEEKVNIEEGDFIYVPRIPSYSFNYYLGNVASYVGIIGSVATVILLLTQFNK